MHHGDDRIDDLGSKCLEPGAHELHDRPPVVTVADQ